MDGIGEMVKIVIFRKVNSGQLVVYSPLDFSEAVTNLFRQFTPYTYLKNENIVAPEDKSNAWKISQTSKIQKLERNCSQKGDTYISFLKIGDNDDPFQVQWFGGRQRNHLWPCWNQWKWWMC